MDEEQISHIFQQILSINTMSRRLLPISDTIHLISYNAQIAAAHAGASGKTLGVMTQEISLLAPAIAEYTDTITSTVNDMARHNADCMMKVRQRQTFKRTAGLLSKEDRQIDTLTYSNAQAQEEISNIFQELKQQLYAIRPIFDAVTDEARRAEMVGALLRIEVARGTSHGLDTQAFMALSSEMNRACTEMKEIAKLCNDALNHITRLSDHITAGKGESSI